MGTPASTATITQIADKVACGGATAANTGKLGCLSLFGTPEHILLLRKGTIIPANTVFNITYLTGLIQNGKLIPLVGASAFEDVSAEDTYSTNTSGVKRLNLKGLPEYKVMFEEGHEFYKQLSKLESYKAFDFILGDDEGNWMLVTRSDGTFSGFSGGHTTPERTIRKVAGGDAESKSFLFQFLDRLQFDENYIILHNDELDFVPSEIPLVNGVDMSFTAIPTAADTTLEVNVVLSGDANTAVEGLLVVNFRYMVEGVAEVPSGITEPTPGNYILDAVVALVAGETITLELWDLSASVDVTDLGGTLYRGNTSAVNAT